jgi:probable rRNA maturation factor
MKKNSKIKIDLTVLRGSALEPSTASSLKVSSRDIKAVARRIGEGLSLEGSELSICLTDDAGIRALNLQYRNKDKATDVLSFPMDDADADADLALASSARVLGDVVISLETARAQAVRFGVELDSEMTRLLVHGILHLLGFDHVNGGRQAARMKREEERLINLIEARV